MNSFEQTLEREFILKDRPLQYKQISRIPLLTFTLVSKYPDMPWDWSVRGLGGREEIDDELYEKHKKQLSTGTLYCANRMNPATVLRYMGNDWVEMSKRCGLSSDFIQSHIDEDWDWRSLCASAALTMEFIERNPRIYYWNDLSGNQYVSRQVLLAYPDRVNWTVASSNPVLSTRFILKHPWDYPWHWGYYGVSDNPTMSRVCVKDIIKQGHFSPLVFISSDISDIMGVLRLSLHRSLDRTRIIKRELLERCWDTNRVMEWCMSVDELAGMTW